MRERQPGSGPPTGSFIASLAEADRTALQRLGVRRAYPRGAVLIAEGARTTEVYLLLTGFVRVVNDTAAGHQSLLAIRSAGEVLGELAAVAGHPRVSTVIAATPAVTRVIDGPRFRAFLDEFPDARTALERMIVEKLRAATRYRVDVGSALVSVRIARVLAHLADAYGRPLGNAVAIDVPLPQVDLASLVGASTAATARGITELRQAQAIRTGYRRIVVVDMARLAMIADGVRLPSP